MCIISHKQKHAHLYEIWENMHSTCVCLYTYELHIYFIPYRKSTIVLYHIERHAHHVCVCIYMYVLYMYVLLYRTTMGWLWSVGSIQSQVSFAEYRVFYRALLQKRPMISSILLTEATPYEYLHVYHIERHAHHYNK